MSAGAGPDPGGHRPLSSDLCHSRVRQITGFMHL